MKTIDKIKVMSASEDGRTIQYRGGDSMVWTTTHCPEWNWKSIEYRVKPTVKNIIIQDLTVEQQDLIEFAIKETGEKAASKAIFRFIEKYRLLDDVYIWEGE